MSAYVGAISQREPRNWDRCKEVGFWGIPRDSVRGHRPRVGDSLFIWRSREGFVAEARITGEARAPIDRSEAPWPGGPRRFGVVVPIEVVREIKRAYRLDFINDRQQKTGLSSNQLRFGLAPITDKAADEIRDAMSAIADEELEMPAS